MTFCEFKAYEIVDNEAIDKENYWSSKKGGRGHYVIELYSASPSCARRDFDGECNFGGFRSLVDCLVEVSGQC